MNTTRPGILVGLVLPFVMAGTAWAAAEARFDYGCEPRASWCAELTCTFDGSASTSTDDQILGWRWYFTRLLREDNERETFTRTGVRVTHTYTSTRCRNYTYQVMLEVTDSLGNTHRHSEQVDASRRLDLPPENQKPVAGFSVACDFLECLFDGGASHDPDGHIASYAWTFGDGSTGSGQTVSHTYASPGAYAVHLTMADGEGATASRASTVSVAEPPPPGFILTATGRRARGGFQVVDLGWTGAGSASVDVYRNDAVIVTTPDDGFHADALGVRGHGTYTYRICAEGTSRCSNDATVEFD
jgi:PKD repeat protein